MSGARTGDNDVGSSDRFDCDWLVIGSGFGGSVSAMRLAQKGYRVVLLEEGKAWTDQSLPKSTWDLKRYLWRPELGCRGILRMNLLRHVLVLGAAGVGGGSLVYGNTLFVPLRSFFASRQIASLGGEAELMPYFELARKMLGVVPNPREFEPDRALRETAETFGRGHTFTPSPVAIHFGTPGESAADPYFGGQGPERVGCTFCGGCFVGCRNGAKNTLDKNYLHFARQFGCEVRADSRAVSIRPLSASGDTGYEVRVSSSESGRRRGAMRTLRARGVVVSAGVMGTLALLLESRRLKLLPRLSGRLGDGVRSNSEAILGLTARSPEVDWSQGIAASSSVFPDEHTQIQADRYPAGSDSMSLLSTILVDGGGSLPRALRWAKALAERPMDALRTADPRGFAKRTVFLIVMQDVDSSLRFELSRSRLPPFRQVLRSRRGDRHIPTYIPIANEFTRRMAERMGAIPRSSVTEVAADIPATAHVMGGCAIGADRTEGVIDARLRVFGYENLLVCDGSIVPANLGVNPVLTILALVERAMSFMPPVGGNPDRFRGLRAEDDWGVSALLHRRGAAGGAG